VHASHSCGRAVFGLLFLVAFFGEKKYSKPYCMIL